MLPISYSDSNAQFLFNIASNFNQLLDCWNYKISHTLQSPNEQEVCHRISKNCFLISGVGCGVAWTFERHVSHELRGFTNAHYITGSRTECEDRCLDERSFTCRWGHRTDANIMLDIAHCLKYIWYIHQFRSWLCSHYSNRFVVTY